VILLIISEGANPSLSYFAIPLFLTDLHLRLSLLHYPAPSVISYDCSLYVVLQSLFLSYSLVPDFPAGDWRVDLGETIVLQR